MKLKEAFSRLRFTLSKGNKPNEKDVEAFNKICEIFALSEKSTIEDNQHYGKLYTWILTKFVPHYNNADEANKHLNKILEMPFHTLVQLLSMELKAMELRQVFRDEFLQTKSPEETKEVLDRYPQFADEFKESWESWDIDNVTAHLNTNINLSLRCLNQSK